jgi:hypothetical protein
VRAQFPCINHLSKEDSKLKLLTQALVMAVVCLSLAGCGAASALPVVEAAAAGKGSTQPSQNMQCTQLPTTTNAKGQRVFAYQCPNYPVFTFTEVKKR